MAPNNSSATRVNPEELRREAHDLSEMNMTRHGMRDADCSPPGRQPCPICDGKTAHASDCPGELDPTQLASHAEVLGTIHRLLRTTRNGRGGNERSETGVMLGTLLAFPFSSRHLPRQRFLSITGLVLAVVTLVLSGCGSGTKGATKVPAAAISVAINLVPCSLLVGHTLSVTASVAGTSNTAVTWSVGGVTNGNLIVGTVTGSGLAITYKAPAIPPPTNPVTIMATSQADATKSASLSITITGSGPTVSVVLTTDDQAQLLQAQASVAFATENNGGNTVFVDENQVYQQIEGYGAAFTDSAAYLLNEVATSAERDSAMNNLFTRHDNGIGLSFMRNPMGASDIARFLYSFDDMPPGQTDPGLSNFSTAHDQQDIIPIILEAKQLNPQLRIMANPWSPPGWMKDSGSMIGGSLLPTMYDAFAAYFVKYVQAYAAAGIPIDYISLQNEPLANVVDSPGMLMDAATQTVILEDHVLPALAANQIDTKVLIYDHNWDRPDYPQTVLSDPVVQNPDQVAGIAWHGYAGTPGVQNNFQSTGNYETEHSGGTWVSDQVKADFEEITQVMRNWGRTFVKWSLALDENRGPHTGGCATCSPLVTVNSGSGTVSYAIDYYTLGHFSKFVIPGASRIYSSNADGIVSVAFLNPDNSKVLVAYNDSNSTQTFQVQWGIQSFTYTLPALGGATFTWTGQQIGGYAINAKSQIQASSFNRALLLVTETSLDTNAGYDVGYAIDGDYALYKNIDFGSGVSDIDVRLASAGTGGTLEFHLDTPDGPLVASVTIPVTGGWQSWTTVSGSASGASGVHDVYALFKGTTSIGNFNWFTFR
jgi:glucosylceramidase